MQGGSGGPAWVPQHACSCPRTMHVPGCSCQASTCRPLCHSATAEHSRASHAQLIRSAHSLSLVAAACELAPTQAGMAPTSFGTHLQPAPDLLPDPLHAAEAGPAQQQLLTAARLAQQVLPHLHPPAWVRGWVGRAGWWACGVGRGVAVRLWRWCRRVVWCCFGGWDRHWCCAGKPVMRMRRAAAPLHHPWQPLIGALQAALDHALSESAHLHTT